jgi:hypothetical protein
MARLWAWTRPRAHDHGLERPRLDLRENANTKTFDNVGGAPQQSELCDAGGVEEILPIDAPAKARRGARAAPELTPHRVGRRRDRLDPAQ